MPRRALGPFILFALALLAALWAASYFLLGVDPLFLLGLARSVAAPPRTPADVTAPAGVGVSVWAQGLASPTSLAFGPDGRLYVAELVGRVVVVAGGPGEAADARGPHAIYAGDLSAPLGLAWHATGLYVGHRGGVTRLRDTDGDGTADQREAVVTGLPAARHQTNGLAFGPDGRLYIGQGSTSDRGETGREPLEAAILVAEPDGTGLRVFASGTRNPYDLAFLPGTEVLFATENGRDVPARGIPDEVNWIVDGGDYGWPACWGASRGAECAGTREPVVELGERVAAGGLAFYTGTLFPQWGNHAFVALYGPNSGDPGVGRRVVRVELAETAAGWQGTLHEFARGFDRPLDLTVGPDGALYVADFAAGLIYRLGAE